MKLYMAGTRTGAPDMEAWKTKGGPVRVLCTYAHSEAVTARHFIEVADELNKEAEEARETLKLYMAGVTSKPQRVLGALAGSTKRLHSAAHPMDRVAVQQLTSGDDDLKLYVAGDLQSEMLSEIGKLAGENRFLKTFAHQGSVSNARYLAEQWGMELDLFIDSGAFTAWKMGKPVDLEAYMAFAQELLFTGHQQLTFAALDVIPGSFSGAYPTEQEFQDAAAQGYRNYEIMYKENGIKCLPTFHQGDPWYWLEKMANDTDHIALSPRKVGKTSTEKMNWLNECFLRIDKWGRLRSLKTHGLGVSSPMFMETYPFYSVDSTAWLQAGTTSGYRFMGSGNYAHAGIHHGHRLGMFPPTEWRRHTNLAIPPIMRYMESKEGTVSLKRGYPWFMLRSMTLDTRLEEYITEHWTQRGVTWETE